MARVGPDPSKALIFLSLLCFLLGGCAHTFHQHEAAGPQLPSELSKAVLPDYIIEPPDILLIDAVSVIPKPPYRISPLDALFVQVPNAFPTQPIAGLYTVEPEGTLNFGGSYGSVRVVGMTLDEARKAIEKLLAMTVTDPKVTVSLGQSRGLQQIRGQHLVTPDGKVNLGVYGTVPVAGLTLQAARRIIEAHLSQFLLDPEISLDVVAYNSKVIYVIFEGALNGEQILRLPVTGNDTVLDVIAQAGGLQAISSKKKIWVARPAPKGTPKEDRVLPVDWLALTRRGHTETNYQLLPGDRVFIHSDPLLRLDTILGRVIAPVERVFGIVLLGDAVSNALLLGPAGPVGALGNQPGNVIVAPVNP